VVRTFLLTDTDEVLEYKMKAVAEEVVRKSSADMNSKLMQRTK